MSAEPDEQTHREVLEDLRGLHLRASRLHTPLASGNPKKVVAPSWRCRGTFSFLHDCAPDARVVIGDARLELAKDSYGFDLLAIDAFSSDSIPLHLMTEEAFATYGRALSRDGLLLVHISNRFIDLAPMVSALAEAGGWHGRLRHDQGELANGLSPSIWIALARSKDRLRQLERDSDLSWKELPPPARRAWTDDNASILPLLRW